MPLILTMSNVLGMGTESGQATTNCLGIPLILREIFHCFSTKELIKLSLVNKLWNYESRSLMKHRGNLTAIIRASQSCEDLRAFASDLRRMKEITKIVPFSGMTIYASDCQPDRKNWRQQWQNDELESVYDDILELITWNYLSVHIFFEPKDLKYCPTFLLVKKVLERFAPMLEEFSIDAGFDATTYFTRKCLRNCKFSRLKTFRLLNDPEPEDGSTGEEYTELIKTVVSRSPNLQSFHSTGEVDLSGNLLEASSAVHVVENGYLYRLNSIPESIVSQLRFSELNLFTFSDLRLESFNNITSKLLQSSRTTLSKMGVDVALLALLMDYGICLENVKNFTLGVDLQYVNKKQSHIWRLVRSFDFTRIFPKLDTVSIIDIHHKRSGIRREFHEMVEQWNAVPKTAVGDRTVNIKHLKLQYLPDRVVRQRSSFQLLADMFPDVQKLTIKGTTFPFAHIGDIWADLEEVDVKLQTERGSDNLDSDFCGIFPEEVAYLREQDEEYLKRMNIVPVMPSIAYLKELRTFTVTFAKTGKHSKEPLCAFSRVSSLIAFQRCPNLAVTLITRHKKLEQALTHLRPFATVVLKKGH